MQPLRTSSGGNRIAQRLKTWAKTIRRDAYVLYLAGRDSRVPLHTKVLALVIAGYALSPWAFGWLYE